MFNNNNIVVNKYIPYYPKEKTCLHDTLLIGKYERIKQDLPDYFCNVKIHNFDIIHNESRGDPLTYNRKYYQQIHTQHFGNIPEENDRCNFKNNAIKSRRSDIYIQKDLMKKHFVGEELKEKFRRKGIFLSSMDKNAHRKKLTKEYFSYWSN